jgi:hypothetical protein
VRSEGVSSNELAPHTRTPTRDMTTAVLTLHRWMNSVYGTCLPAHHCNDFLIKKHSLRRGAHIAQVVSHYQSYQKTSIVNELVHTGTTAAALTLRGE